MMRETAEPCPSPRGRRGQTLLCLTTLQPPAPPGRSTGEERGLGPRGTGPRQTEQAAERRGPPGQALPPPAPTVPQEPRRPHRARPSSGEGSAPALHSPLMVAAGLAPSVRRTRSHLPRSPKPGRPAHALRPGTPPRGPGR